MGRPSRFSPEVRERAVRMVEEHREAHASEWAVLQSVAPKLGCTAETLRKWVRQAQRDAGHRPGLTTSERERLKDLEREVRELKRANEILRKASRSSGALRGRADLRGVADRPIDVSPSARRARIDPTRQSARAQRDATLRDEIQRVYDEHHHVYRPRKVWKQLRRDGIRAARCTVGRLYAQAAVA